MSAILEFIDSNEWCKPFRKRYQKTKYNKKSSFELEITNEFSEYDISLVVIQQTDNHTSHAIAMTGNYIFDCNIANALPRTKDGIDCCCGTANFEQIHSGFVWKANKFVRNEYEKHLLARKNK